VGRSGLGRAQGGVGYVSLGGVTNVSALQVDPSATLASSGVLSFATLLNQGQINVASGDSLALGNVASAASAGLIDLRAGAMIEFNGPVANQTLVFNPPGGTAAIDQPAEFAGTISSFTSPGDIVDLTQLSAAGASATLNGGDQLVVSSGTQSVMLQLDTSVNYTGVTWQTSPDNGSGTDVAVVCFCRGTLIQTDCGEVPVEELKIGDRVETLSGIFKPIVWIGFGRSLVNRANRLVRPVIVRRGALADNVPRRDLYLTHGHALYFDGVLIPVENLVNHRSILWDETARAVEYYHLELEDHEVVLAEGAPAETYFDAGNRAVFQNTREGSAAGAAKPTFAPVLQTGEIVESAWAALFARAGGHLETNTTEDPDLHLLADGERLDPMMADDGVYSFAVARPPAATLLLCSRSAVPSLLGLGRSDHRRLGAPIGRIILWHAGIPTSFDHDAPQFREGGCHQAEDGYCWTDGEFQLPARFFTLLNGAFTLVVHTKRHCMRYPMAAALAAAA
jgi:hypothetical protein